MQEHPDELALADRTARGGASAPFTGAALAEPDAKIRVVGGRGTAARRAGNGRRGTGARAGRALELALEHLARHPRGLAGVAEVEVARERIGRGAKSGQQPVERLPLAPKVGEPAAAVEDLDLPL
jgi:hypothetical protein